MPFCSQCGTDNPDIAKFCFACGAPLVAATFETQEFRKIVTIVFSDLKGSTAMGEKLDSESLREVMTRYFDAMRAELELHGGVVEKFIGDAVMAVFGLPKLHEDDALRAVRAAAGMQRAQATLNDELERHWGVRLTVRTGVNTGEVVAGDPTSGQRLVTGDAVNVAARLEQAAGAQEILLGDLTYRLVRDFVEVEPVEPLELKGKSEPVPAYRLVAVHEAAERPRRLDAPMIGRDPELGLLRSALDEVTRERRCRLVTVIGEAGVGKSRLIDEFVRSVEGDASFLRGRCLPYGDGITFWPLGEAIRQAAGILERDSTEVALTKLSALSGDAEAEARVASAIGLSSTHFALEELFWGARKMLETLARPGPLLVLFEDVHWAEASFLDLVKHVVDLADDAPLLLVCSTRHELLERVPEWSTEPRAARIALERLTEDETAAVAEHLLGSAGLEDRVRARVLEAADGNPLFVEQLLSMLIDEGLISFENGYWRAGPDIDRAVVPPTIQALLASRLDYLEQDERAVIEPASVIGHVFVTDAVSHLVPERVRDDVGARLGALTEKQLVHPDLSRSLEEEGFRFHHVLIRDTAYDGILKRARATFHEQFVQWADSVNREGATEYEEILGYHLEQAHRYLSELGPLDEHGRMLGEEGSRRLASAGRRAFARGDSAAAASLLGRAADLLPEDDPGRIELLPEVGEALLQAGRFQDAHTILAEAVEQARAGGATVVAAHASLVLLLVRLRTGDPTHWQEEAAETIAEAMAIFQGAGDHAGMARGWRLLAWTHGIACRFGLAADAHECALEEAQLAHDKRQQSRSATAYAVAAVFGPTPVPEALARCGEMLELVSGDRHSEGILLGYMATLHAMQSSFEEARSECGRGRAMLEELGLDVEGALLDVEAWRIEMLANDPSTAERELRRAYNTLCSVGEKFILSTVSVLLAQTQYLLGDLAEADRLVALTEELASEDDIDAQAQRRSARAKLLALDGEPERAEALAREALDLLAPTDAVLLKFGALADLAEVYRLSGREDEALAALENARQLAEEKRSSAFVDAAQRLVEALRAHSAVDSGR